MSDGVFSFFFKHRLRSSISIVYFFLYIYLGYLCNLPASIFFGCPCALHPLINYTGHKRANFGVFVNFITLLRDFYVYLLRIFFS